MKKLFVPTLSVFLAIACIQEEKPSVQEHSSSPGEARVRIVLCEETPGTKSVVSSAVENFTCAYLFAFDSNTKTICLSGDGAPVSLYTEQKSFDWLLPSGLDADGREQRMDIWTVVNPDESNELILKDFLERTDLREEELESMRFRCADSDAMLRMESFGMPMSGTLSDIYLESQDDPIVFTLRRLFAKYDLKINTSLFESQGWSVKAARVEAGKSNTAVPFFHTGGGAGYKAAAEDLAAVDFATAEDLARLNTMDADSQSVQAITLYFLENCQGDVSSGASKWNAVGTQLGSRVEACSYVEFSVTASKSGYGTRSFKYRLYPGQRADMCSNFDIIRNRHKKINITLEAPTDGFSWTGGADLAVMPGESISIPFETSLLYSPDEAETELVFRSMREDSQSSDLVLESVDFDASLSNLDRPAGVRMTNFQYFGTASFRAAESAAEGPVQVLGSDKSGDISSPADVEITFPFYKGFQLGRLGLERALGVPVDTGDGESAWMKAVSMPDSSENPYLWEGIGNVWQLSDEFSSKYEVAISFVSSAGDAYSPNVKLWWFDNGSYPTRFYYGASSAGTPGSILPAHCIVKIHCFDDPRPDFRIWFEFDNIIPYEYSYGLSSSCTSTSWTGQISVGLHAKCTRIERGSPSEDYDQPSAFYDLHPACLPMLKISRDLPACPQGTSATSILGTQGEQINLAMDSSFNPIYSHKISGTSTATLSGGYSFPADFDGWYLNFNSPKASLFLEGAPVRTAVFEGTEYYLLPSHYLTSVYGSYTDSAVQLPYYPGLLLRKGTKSKWEDVSYTPESPYIAFSGPAGEVAAGTYTDFHYVTNQDGADCVFTVEPAGYFHISSTDKTRRVISVYCEENTPSGEVATLKAFNTARTASDTHVFRTITDHYKLNLYAAYDYNWAFPLLLHYKRTNTDYYAFTLETVRESTSIPVFTYNGDAATIRTPSGAEREIEDVVACIECSVAGKPGVKCYLYPKTSGVKGRFWYHNDLTCYYAGSSHLQENPAISRAGGYYGRFVSFSVQDSDLGALGSPPSLASYDYYPLIPTSFSFTEEFADAVGRYPRKAELMKAAQYDYD
ncbi:MAG: DUF4906 domain-containing protein [Bacteroidales bacterium]|nr:DUF4906 domain-containing protein [Bacteroidales bacterium]